MTTLWIQADPNDGSKQFTIGCGTTPIVFSNADPSGSEHWIQAVYHRLWDTTSFVNTVDPGGSERWIQAVYHRLWDNTYCVQQRGSKRIRTLDPSCLPSAVGPHRLFQATCLSGIRTMDPSCLPSALGKLNTADPNLPILDPSCLPSVLGHHTFHGHCGSKRWIQAVYHRLWDNTACFHPRGPQSPEHWIQAVYHRLSEYSTLRIQISRFWIQAVYHRFSEITPFMDIADPRDPTTGSKVFTIGFEQIYCSAPSPYYNTIKRWGDWIQACHGTCCGYLSRILRRGCATANAAVVVVVVVDA